MAIITEWIRTDHVFGYRAQPERTTGPLPGVIVIQEAFGVDQHIEDVTRRFAAAGYVAIAPDLFSVNGERPPELTRERLVEVLAWINTKPIAIWLDPTTRAAALAELPADQAARLGESITSMMAKVMNPDALMPSIIATATYLREADPCARGQKIAVLGFCMGGGLAARLACADPDLATAIVFYGMAPPVEQVERGRCSVLGLYGADDARINDSVPAFAAAMAAAGRRFEQERYPGAPHAFFNDSRPGYRPDAARAAFVRALTWLRDHLAP